MKIFIGADHAGFEMKQELMPFLRDLGHEVIDCGPTKFNPEDDYDEYCFDVADSVSQTFHYDRNILKNFFKKLTGHSTEYFTTKDVRGIVIGGSGEGEAIVANRVWFVRVAVYYGGPLDIIKLSREHNDSNVLSLGARFIDEQEAKRAVQLWLDTPFSNEERHIRRINKINKRDFNQLVSESSPLAP